MEYHSIDGYGKAMTIQNTLFIDTESELLSNSNNICKSGVFSDEISKLRSDHRNSIVSEMSYKKLFCIIIAIVSFCAILSSIIFRF